MNKQKTTVIVALVIGLISGYFLGREHIKYEIRSTMKQAFTGFGKRMQTVFGGGKDTETKPSGEVVVSQESYETTNYIQEFLEAYDISSRYQNDIMDGRVAVVFGKLKNNGEQTLKKVEVTAYFLDSHDSVIFENSFSAVLAGGIMSDDTPLKPNYIKEFGFKTRDCPSEWCEGKIKLAITDVEFD